MSSDVPIVSSFLGAVKHCQTNYLIGSRVIDQIEGDRGPFCAVIRHSDKNHYFLTFNRKWFFGFHTYFPNVILNRGSGSGLSQSFKLSLMQMAANMKGYLLTIMPNGRAYFANAEEALAFVEANQTTHIPPTDTEPDGYIPATMMKRLSHPLLS